LKTPTFTVQEGPVHYLIEGVGHVYAAVDSHLIINGPLHGELVRDTGGNSDLPAHWITQDLSRYIGHRAHLEFSPKGEADFRVLMVVEGGPRPKLPTNGPNQLLQTVAAGKSKSPPATAAACREVVEAVLQAMEQGKVGGDPLARDRAAIANWMVAEGGLGSDPGAKLAAALADHQRERDRMKAAIQPESRLCMAMWDGTGIDENVLIRGNHKTPGSAAHRRLLTALDRGTQKPDSPERGSGRLALARRLAQPDNPLTARVMVNRLWHHLLGRGIVASVDNFGVLGELPTHPELLDHLAVQFTHEGWSIKRLIRTIMLSSTYQQASISNGHGAERAEQVDPQNRLFHRQNMKRLEGEAIRDAVLALSGRLDATMYGPSVPVYLSEFMQGRGRPGTSGPVDGNGRRSIYIAVRRNFLQPLMLAFDTPIPSSTVGRRNVSNVPAQALILMNDPLIVEQSRSWAQKLLARDLSRKRRMVRMYQEAFGREPTSDEVQEASAFLTMQVKEYEASGMAAEERAWADLAHVLINAKEFVFIP
jgi:hypothetical protein